MGLTMSLDGFIAGPNDGPEQPLGEGGMRLFDWYSAGDTDYGLPGTEMVFRVSPQSVELLREAHARMGAFVTGRRTFDITNGWGGNPPLGVPAFVVTHSASPQEWVYEGSPFTFVTDGVESAVEQARAVGGRQGRRRWRGEHRAAVPKGRAARRDTRRPRARPARGWCQVVRASGRADRAGTYAGGRRNGGHAPDVPRRKGGLA